ncbi:MAG: helix-turn-helix transcriptional regulator [Dorea sp.]|nr:helix-turn-helix transcriptional regulator [Dorea sp.]
MELNALLKQKNMSVYQCSRESKVPYTTLLDLVKGKTRIEKCAAETVYKIAKALGIAMEELLQERMEGGAAVSHRSKFETFKSNVCHLVKDKGDIDFIIDTLKSDKIRDYWRREWYPESFYLLAMVDYLSKHNGLPLCREYDDIRSRTLSEPLYPRDIMLMAKLDSSLDMREQSRKEAIPEFMRFNIVESEIRNVY